MKRVISFILAAVLLLGLSVGVCAADADYTYSVTVDGQSDKKVPVDTEIEVVFAITKNDNADKIDLYSITAHLWFETEYLEYVKTESAQLDGKDLFTYSNHPYTTPTDPNLVTVMRATAEQSVIPVENPLTVVTVTFKTLKEGSTWVKLQNCEFWNDVSNKASVKRSDLTLTIGDVTTYTVTLDYGTGKTDTQTIEEGGKVKKPADPTREGYDFGGWYKGDKLWDFDKDTVDADTTLTAKWTVKAPEKYTLTFDTNGGSTISSIQREKGTTVDLSTFKPTKDGYDFDGWYSDAGLTNKITSVTMNANATVYAGWTVKAPEKFTVTLDYGTGKTETQTIEKGGKVAKPADPTRDGYNFGGWYSGDKLWDFDKDTVDADTTLTAKWTAKAKYTITFDNDGADKKINPVTDVEGTVIDLTEDEYIPEKNGYKFDGWYDANGTKVTKVTLGEDITLKAKWSKLAADTVTLKFVTNGGSSISDKTFDKGSTVDLGDYSTRRSGYTFDGWYLDSKLTEAAKETFTINKDTTVYAKWEKKDSSGSGSGSGNGGGKTDEDEFPFVDVSKDQYYYEPVKWAVDKGITTGTSATTFSPDGPCTRAQMVTFLWRTSGCPEAKSTACPFTDVETGAYYYKALLWAIETGVTKGTSPTTFSPNDICTRGQMVTFLHRYSGEPAVTAGNPFTDVTLDDFFYTAVVWAADNGITKGTSATTFSPFAPCTRAQIVTFLYRSVNG